MYPSNNSNSNHNPTSFIDGQIIMHPTRPFFNNNDNIISPNSSTSLFQFPSSSHTPQYEDAGNDLTWQQLHDLFFIYQSSNLTSTGPALAKTVIMEADPKRVNVSTRIKKSSKKDRHSKINTAHGPRDRRMRVSLDVARKFFDLQDMLGFDKASKTVEWLLNRSNSAIQEISGSNAMRGSISVSFTTSECEGVLRIDHESITTKIKSSCSGNNKVKKKKKKKANRKASFHKMARDSRIIARERARKRTWEKKKMELLDNQYSNKSSCIISEEITMANYLKSFGSWSQFESGGKCDQESIINQYPTTKIKSSCSSNNKVKKKKKKKKKANRKASFHKMARDSRIIARERARKRTWEHHQQILGTIEYAGNWNTSSTTCTLPQNSQISNEVIMRRSLTMRTKPGRDPVMSDG